MATVSVTREPAKPTPPPAIKDVVLTLSFEEACALYVLALKTGGKPEGLRGVISGITDAVQEALPSSTRTSLWEILSVIDGAIPGGHYGLSFRPGTSVYFTGDSLEKLRAAIGEKP